jgi:hypothetical protein
VPLRGAGDDGSEGGLREGGEAVVACHLVGFDSLAKRGAAAICASVIESSSLSLTELTSSDWGQPYPSRPDARSKITSWTTSLPPSGFFAGAEVNVRMFPSILQNRT